MHPVGSRHAMTESSCNGPHWTGLLSSKSLDGPWLDEGQVLLTTNKSNAWITNPCVTPAGLGSGFAHHHDENTTYLLYRQSGPSWPGDGPDARERLGWAFDPNCPTAINCTFRDMSPELPILNVSLEDQYLWRDHRGNWHALTHKNGAGGVSGHLWRHENGTSWRISPVSPYSNTIQLQDGSAYECGKRARPMLLVEKGRPRFLSTGATYAKAEHGGDHTFTTMQEISGDQ